MPVSVDTPQGCCRFAVARCDITPPVGIYHRMWGAAAHDRSTGIHRRLTATAFLMGPLDGSEADRVVIAVDHCILWGEDMDRLRAAVARFAEIEADPLLFVVSHTHAAGLLDSTRADRPGGDLIGPYLDRLSEQLASLVGDVRARARPATLCYGQGWCTLAANRDFLDELDGRIVCGFNPAAPADDTVLVARATAEDGTALATFVNYACHPTTLAWQNTLISPDFPGAMRDVVESATGSPCVFLQGASGDLGPREGFVGDVAVADRNGRQLGYAALAVLEGLPPAATRFAYSGAVESGAVIGTWRHVPFDSAQSALAAQWHARHVTVPLAYRPDLPDRQVTQSRRDSWEAEGQTALGRGDLARAAECRAFVERMDRQLLRLKLLPAGPEYPFPVQLWKSGDAVWIAVEGEPYQHLQVELRRRFPETPLVIMTLANGGRSVYLPTAGAYGRGIYQERIAVLGAGCLERLTDSIASELQSLIAPRPSSATHKD
jgi:hypothetical protein